MDYTLSLTRHVAEVLDAHLLGDRSREQMAVTLCGVNRLHRELRLLVRDVILLPPDAFRHQTAVRLELKPEVQAFIHQRAHEQGLIQVDWHSHCGPLSSHPGNGGSVAFSATDDEHEAAQAAYLSHRMEGVPFGSVVVSDGAMDARLWITRSRQRKGKDGRVRTVVYRPQAQPLQAVLLGDLRRVIPATARRGAVAHDPALSAVHDRQVRAFGQAFQRRLGELRVGIVGLGGLGSALAAHLGRLGVRDWVLVDPDVVELTNLNRLVNATVTDAQGERPKVYVARSSVRQSNPNASVRALQTDVFDPEAQRALKACDLLVVATDNHASRMAANRLAVQYLIPLLHAGFHIGVDALPPSPSPAGQGKDGATAVTDVSGEFAIPDLGRWCLQCAGIVDPQQAGWELAPAAQREVLRQRGYVDGTPAPAVCHLDGTVAALAATEIHNLVHPFRPVGDGRTRRYLVYDALRAELTPLGVTPSDGCPVCSPEDGVLGLGDLEPLPDYRRKPQLPSAVRLATDAGESRAATLLPMAVGEPEAAADDGLALQLATPSPQPGGNGELVPDVRLPNRRARAQRLQVALDAGPDADWP
jgi:molybdopterin-synthase adenylyltransferase